MRSDKKNNLCLALWMAVIMMKRMTNQMKVKVNNQNRSKRIQFQAQKLKRNR